MLNIEWFSHGEYYMVMMSIKVDRVWKLKAEETARLFTHEMAARNDGY